MANEVRDAWDDERVPLVNAVTFVDGEMILLEIARHADGSVLVRPLAKTTLASYLSFNPDWWANVTSLCETQMADGQSFVAGEGSQGSDGFLAKRDARGALVYCVFFTSSNPFIMVTVSSSEKDLEVVNNRGERWSICIAEPWVITRSTQVMTT